MPVPSTEELRDFIDDPLKAKLEANQKIYNKQSRRTRLFTTVYLMISLPVTCAVTTGLGIGQDGGFWSTYWASFALVGGWIALYGFAWIRYFREEMPFEYGRDVVVPLVHYLEPRLKGPAGGFDADELDETELFFGPVEQCKTGEYFSGSMRSIEMSLGDVEVSASASGGQTLEFDGLVFVTTYPVQFDEKTVIFCGGRKWPEDKSPRQLVGSRAQRLDGDCGDKIEIWTVNPESARKYLTPAVRERFEALCEVFDDGNGAEMPPFYALLSGRRLAVACDVEEFFERGDSSRICDTTHLHRIGAQLRGLIDVAESLEIALRQ